MLGSPTISVVMPVHNGERFLREAVVSILTQTFTDLELIVVDDGSTDGTPVILEELATADPRLIVIRFDVNRGVSEAANEGCRRARGSFIARMDADDVSLPERLEKELAFLEANPDVAVVGSWVRRIDEHGAPGEVQTLPCEPALVAWSMLFFNSIAHPTALFRREALTIASVYTSEYPRTEDYALLSVLSRQTRLANIPEVLLHYRVWSGNMSKNPDQFRQAARVVCDHAKALGVELTEEDAGRLQGLARNSYPENEKDVRQLARIILELHGAVKKHLPAGADTSLMDNDAGVRLWLLAVLSAPRSPLLAASLVRHAFRLHPTSMLAFLGRVTSRLHERRAVRRRAA
jgi:glycosyltransferase involved in cell wall biosynthesis